MRIESAKLVLWEGTQIFNGMFCSYWLSSLRKLLTTMGDGSRDIIMKDSEIQQKLLNSPILLHGFLVISSFIMFIMFIMGEVHLIEIQLQLQKIFPVLHKNLFIYFNTLLLSN